MTTIATIISTSPITLMVFVPSGIQLIRNGTRTVQFPISSCSWKYLSQCPVICTKYLKLVWNALQLSLTDNYLLCLSVYPVPFWSYTRVHFSSSVLTNMVTKWRRTEHKSFVSLLRPPNGTQSLVGAWPFPIGSIGQSLQGLCNGSIDYGTQHE